jgi:hypothetical protein
MGIELRIGIRIIHILPIVILLPLYDACGQAGINQLYFERLPDLPAADEGSAQIGLAGGFAGVHHGVMIFAGGANFPDAPPWEGMETQILIAKKYHEN